MKDFQKKVETRRTEGIKKFSKLKIRLESLDTSVSDRELKIVFKNCLRLECSADRMPSEF